MYHPSPGSGWWLGVRFPCFRLAAALRHTLGPDVSAVLIERGGRRRVLEAAGAAAAGGVRPGTALREAIRLAPAAAVVLDDPARASRNWRRVLDRLARLPAPVEDGEPGLAFLRLDGVQVPERWFGLVRDALAPVRLAVRCGAAANRFAALVATHRAADAVCRSGAEANFVADAPVELLALGEDELLRLRLLGVRTLGDLAALPPPHLTPFGSDALRWRALACGGAGESGGDEDRLAARPARGEMGR